LRPGVAFTGTLAAAVQDGRYSGVRLLPGQRLNKFAGLGVGLPAVLTGPIFWYRQPRVIPALPMNHKFDRIADDFGHDLDDCRPQDMLARLSGRTGMMPQPREVRFARDSLVEGADLPPISKRKKQGNNLGTPSWCSPSKASVAPCSLCQGRFAPAPPVPPH